MFEASVVKPFRPGLLLLCMLLAGVAVGVDWLTGPEVASSIVYLLPVSLAAWKGGRWKGLGMALICGVAWLGVEAATNKGYSSSLILIWNALVRTSVFCLVSGLMSEVRRRRRVEQSLRQSQIELERRAASLAASEAALQKQTDILQSILDSMGDGVVAADVAGGLMLRNPAAQRILRLPAQLPDARQWLDSDPAFEPERPAGTFWPQNPLVRAIGGESLDDVELCLRHQNAPEGIWLSASARPLLDASSRSRGGIIVFSDITARRQLEQQIAEVSDREQQRIGEDLHDGLCQHLVSVAFAARRIAGQLAGQSVKEADDVAKIAEMLAACISQARTVARGLYLVPRDAGGLTVALDELAARTTSQHQIACQYVDEASEPITEEVVVTNLFRVAQEAVNNAVKHSGGKHITITLTSAEQQVSLKVEDDGGGIKANATQSRGMGVHLMTHRARIMGANFNITLRPEGGTVVCCTVRRAPVPEVKAHE